MGEQKQGPDQKKLLILLKSGLNAPGVARAGLMFASIGATFGLETVVYCVQEGADVAIRGSPEKEEVKPGKPTLKQRLQEAIDAGVRLEVCQATAVLRGIKQEDLIEQAKIVGGGQLIELALKSDAVLCF